MPQQSSSRQLHPLIRLLLFLVFAILMARANLPQLITSSAVLLVWLAARPASAVGIKRRLFRLRWLFLSIITVYSLMTPGRSIIPSGGSWWPTVEGLSGGLHQCLVLVLIVTAVHLLLYYCSRDQLLQGIRGFLQPLARLGVPHERIALRIMLVFEVLPRVQSLVESELGQIRVRHMSVKRLGQFAVRLFEQTEAAARDDRQGAVSLERISYPPFWQWGLPLLLAVLLWLSRMAVAN